MCICGKSLTLKKLKELFPELKDPIDKFYERVQNSEGQRLPGRTASCSRN